MFEAALKCKLKLMRPETVNLTCCTLILFILLIGTIIKRPTCQLGCCRLWSNISISVVQLNFLLLSHPIVKNDNIQANRTQIAPKVQITIPCDVKEKSSPILYHYFKLSLFVFLFILLSHSFGFLLLNRNSCGKSVPAVSTDLIVERVNQAGARTVRCAKSNSSDSLF